MRGRTAGLVVAVLLAACGQRGAPDTVGELRGEIARYERADPAASEERIAALFATLDAEIAQLRADELSAPGTDRPPLAAQREARTEERRDLQTAYVKARIARLGVAAEEALRGMAQQLGRGLEDAGRALQDVPHPPSGP